MKKFIYFSLMMILFSACSTSFKTSSSINKKIPLDLVKAKNKNELTAMVIPTNKQDINIPLASKQVGVSIPSYSDDLKLLQSNFNLISHTKAHHSILASIIQKKIIKKITKLNQSYNSTSSPVTSMRTGLIIGGAIVLFIGLLILLFVDILGGSLLTVLGLILLIIGLCIHPQSNNYNQPQQEQLQKQYQDVVYLKNGSIIRGMIIEQVPNISLKIQTKDGSVFVYQMTEVEKITKELEK